MSLPLFSKKQSLQSKWLLPAILFLTVYLIVDFTIGILRYQELSESQQKGLSENDLVARAVKNIHPDKKKLRIPNQYYHHGFEANFETAENWGPHSVSIATNSLGLIDLIPREVELKKKHYRVLFIGDSFVEGCGVPYEKTFVGLIDKALVYNDIDVLNAACASYSPKLYYAKLKYLIEQVGLKLDELFVFVDYADIADEIVYRNFFPKGFTDDELYQGVFFLKDENQLNHFWEYSLTFRALSKLLFAKDPWSRVIYKHEACHHVVQYEPLQRTEWSKLNQKGYQNWVHEGFESSRFYLTKLIELAKQHNIAVTLAAYPWPIEVKSNQSNSYAVFQWESLAEANNIAFFNLYPVFISKEKPDGVVRRYYIKNDVHWNARGHKKVAEAWLKDFRKKHPDLFNYE